MRSRPSGPQVRIRDYREMQGISVNELVERIKQQGYTGRGGKLSPDTIRNVELGYKPASRLLMAAWAQALGLKPVDVWQPNPKDDNGVAA